MTISAFVSAALVSAALLTPALAADLVPGSDHYTEAGADAATHGVATGVRPPVVTTSITETRSFGYPAPARSSGVPGSRTETRARDDAAVDAVARGAFTGRAAPATGLVPGVVPGSDAD